MFCITGLYSLVLKPYWKRSGNEAKSCSAEQGYRDYSQVALMPDDNSFTCITNTWSACRWLSLQEKSTMLLLYNLISNSTSSLCLTWYTSPGSIFFISMTLRCERVVTCSKSHSWLFPFSFSISVSPAQGLQEREGLFTNLWSILLYDLQFMY